MIGMDCDPQRGLAAAESLPFGRHLYLFQHRPQWRTEAGIGKTVVSTQMIDRVAAKLGRKLCEVPVGFKWFVAGLLDGSLGFGGERERRSLVCSSGCTVWTTDKDGLFRLYWRRRSQPGWAAIPARSTTILRTSSASLCTIALRPLPLRPKGTVGKALTPPGLRSRIAGEQIQTVLTRAPGNDAPIGGVKVVAKKWMVRSASVRDRGHLQDLCGELPGNGPSASHSGGSAGHRQRCPGASPRQSGAALEPQLKGTP